jgi:hypothetical protein
MRSKLLLLAALLLIGVNAAIGCANERMLGDKQAREILRQNGKGAYATAWKVSGRESRSLVYHCVETIYINVYYKPRKIDIDVYRGVGMELVYSVKTRAKDNKCEVLQESSEKHINYGLFPVINHTTDKAIEAGNMPFNLGDNIPDADLKNIRSALSSLQECLKVLGHCSFKLDIHSTKWLDLHLKDINLKNVRFVDKMSGVGSDKIYSVLFKTDSDTMVAALITDVSGPKMKIEIRSFGP